MQVSMKDTDPPAPAAAAARGGHPLPSAFWTLPLTLAALLAFAANSILCRMALGENLIDPVSFTQIRLGAGALALLPFLWRRRAAAWPPRPADWRPALALFVYATGFSLAYLALEAGAGALILFATVQVSMIGLGLLGGDRPGAVEWAGLALALAGLGWLLAPGLHAPPLWAAALMGLAGAAWGVYSLLGRAERDPLAATARNFLFTVPLALALFAAGPDWAGAQTKGIMLAMASGALTSGLGYVIWYAALRGLTPMSASIVQLAVPAVAAAGGVLLLGEALTLRLLIATALILGGIFVTVHAGRCRRVH
jgi:drug/metabolite transporter (DMT)-like permease